MKTMTAMHKNGNLGIKRTLKRDYLKAGEQITDKKNEVTSSAKNAVKDVQAYCRENPGKAMGAAAGVAAVVILSLVKAFSRKESVGEKIFSDLFRTGEKAWKQVKSSGQPASQAIK